MDLCQPTGKIRVRTFIIAKFRAAVPGIVRITNQSRKEFTGEITGSRLWGLVGGLLTNLDDNFRNYMYVCR